MVFAAFPRSGPPPRFADYADYAEVVGHLERTGCIADYTHIWWDVRLHPRLGTVEIRICDAVTRVEDAVAITAYCQALVKHYSERFDEGLEIPSYHRILTTENKWLAARYGLEAPVMDLATGRRNRVPVSQLIRRNLRDLAPHARELGADRELEGIREILSRGNSADHQRRIFNANRDIVEVVARDRRRDRSGCGSRLDRVMRETERLRVDDGEALRPGDNGEPARLQLELRVHDVAGAPPRQVDAEGAHVDRVERVDEQRAARADVKRVDPPAGRARRARDRGPGHRAFALLPRVEDDLPSGAVRGRGRRRGRSSAARSARGAG